MKEWICIYCGTTMSSKCPGQRSEFYGQEMSVIRNALATHVLDVAQGKKEVFLNLSFWGDCPEDVDPVIATIDQLSEWRDKLVAASCDHQFVINSKERTECQLGHEHYNLNDKERLLAEREKPAEWKVTFEDVKKTYIDFLGDQMNLAKSNLQTLCPEVKRDTPEYDEYRRWYFVFQDEMDQIKYAMQRGIDRLKHGQPYRKKYEVSFGYQSDIPAMYTDDILQAEAVYKYYQRAGVKCRLGELRPEKADSTSIQYYPLEKDPDVRQQCGGCKVALNPGDKVSIAEPVQYDHKGREVAGYPPGTILCPVCTKQHTVTTKTFTVHIYNESDGYVFEDVRRRKGDLRAMEEVIFNNLKEKPRELEVLEVTEIEDGYRSYRIKVRGYGTDLEAVKSVIRDLRKDIEPTPTKKENKS
jgi:hypothetical protein